MDSMVHVSPTPNALPKVGQHLEHVHHHLVYAVSFHQERVKISCFINFWVGGFHKIKIHVLKCVLSYSKSYYTNFFDIVPPLRFWPTENIFGYFLVRHMRVMSAIPYIDWNWVINQVKHFLTLPLACGGTSSANNSYAIINSFNVATDTDPCTYTFCKANSDVCKLRIEYTSMVLSPPGVVSGTVAPTDSNSVGDCKTDTLTVTSPEGR